MSQPLLAASRLAGFRRRGRAGAALLSAIVIGLAGWTSLDRSAGAPSGGDPWAFTVEDGRLDVDGQTYGIGSIHSPSFRYAFMRVSGSAQILPAGQATAYARFDAGVFPEALAYLIELDGEEARRLLHVGLSDDPWSEGSPSGAASMRVVASPGGRALPAPRVVR
jgi:hypothetical protein